LENIKIICKETWLAQFFSSDIGKLLEKVNDEE
jgi:hypothetical protein